jgi:hypothetical protein
MTLSSPKMRFLHFFFPGPAPLLISFAWNPVKAPEIRQKTIAGTDRKI